MKTLFIDTKTIDYLRAVLSYGENYVSPSKGVFIPLLPNTKLSPKLVKAFGEVPLSLDLNRLFDDSQNLNPTELVEKDGKITAQFRKKQ